MPEVQLIGSLVGTDFTGSASGYYNITLSAPWGGTNTRGGLNSIIYFRNKSNNASVDGNITYTIPEGYNNATFTMKITTGSTSDGDGNLTVATPNTAAVGHNFAAGETFAWLVTASTGQKITITSTDANYSPDIAKIEVYTGDATAATLMMKAAESGDADSRLITGITDKSYTVENLTANGTFLYRVKALYVNGTESAWSNVEEVTLSQSILMGDVNRDGQLSITDVTALVDYLLDDTTDIDTAAADLNGDGAITITDVTSLIDLLLASDAQTANFNMVKPVISSGK